VSAFDALAGLELRVDDYALEGLVREVSSDFTRRSTVIRLRGGGQEGVGEDVTYDGDAHEILQETGPVQPLAGSWTLASFCDHVESLDLWPQPPGSEAFRHYRLWAYESAALDLALRQAGAPLHEVLALEPRPLTFVVSLRLGDPPTLDPVLRRLDRYPALRFKLDPTSDWTEEIVAGLQATGAVDSVDLKGLYANSVVDQGADPALYRMVAEAFPDAWIEDPRLTEETSAVLAPHRDRITWDANIHSVADIEGLPFPPRMVNIKPSRLGTLRELTAAYDFCAHRGIGMYGGGQFELGPGRGQIQYLASMLHPDTPNDVAPGGYNDADPPAGLPDSPLAPQPAPTGFRWGEWADR
jgi:L-alanine-DL-glutamate epimerase-like enolase superfamily enzyme